MFPHFSIDLSKLDEVMMSPMLAPAKLLLRSVDIDHAINNHHNRSNVFVSKDKKHIIQPNLMKR